MEGDKIKLVIFPCGETYMPIGQVIKGHINILRIGIFWGYMLIPRVTVVSFGPTLDH